MFDKSEFLIVGLVVVLVAIVVGTQIAKLA